MSVLQLVHAQMSGAVRNSVIQRGDGVNIDHASVKTTFMIKN